MQIHYLIGSESRVNVADRGLAYGDGLFETIAVCGGTLRRLALHLERLRLGCRRLALPEPEPVELERQMRLAVTGIEHGVLKLMLTRGNGPRGYAPPPDPELTIVLLATAGDLPVARTLTLVTLQQRLGENANLAGIKHLCRLEQVLGRVELAAVDADEGLMLSSSGAVIGGTSRNIFAVFGQSLLTPDLTRAGICGVMRRAVLEQCEALGIPVSVGDIAPEDLRRADEIFMTNALVGIESVSRLDDQPFSRRGMAERLRGALGLAGHPDTAGDADANADANPDDAA